MQVDVSELNQLAVDLGRAGFRVQADVAKLTRQTALDIETTAKLFVPVLTGNLKRSIHHTISLGGLSAVIGTNVEYAAFVEFGTSRMAPHAYLGPAFDRHVPDYIAGIERIVRSVV